METQDYLLFLKVAARSSFAQASAELEMPLATMVRRVNSLETQLGFKLFKRSPRGLQLTDHGRRLTEEGQKLTSELARLNQVVRDLAIEGSSSQVTISATEPVISELLAPHLRELLTQPRCPRIELRVENRLSSISLGEADIAIRLVPPQDSDLACFKLATFKAALVSSRDYQNQVLADARNWEKRLRILGYDGSYGEIPEIRWLANNGFAQQISATTSSTRALLEAVAAGAGAAVLPTFLADRRDLVELSLVSFSELPVRDVWLIWHKHMSNHPPVRLTLDWVKACFQGLAPGNTRSDQ